MTTVTQMQDRIPVRRRVARILLVAAGALAAGLVLGELGLRWWHPIGFRAPIDHRRGDEWRRLVHRASSLPGLPYELNPGAHGHFLRMDCAVNSLGMRGPEVDVHKAPHVLRIAAIGDSVTFGWNVSADATWPAQLDRALLERGPGAGTATEVLNCGVSGYGTRDEAIALDQRAAELDPDVVVLAYFLNDPEHLPLAPLQRYFEVPEWWQRFNLLRLVARTSYEHDVQRFGGGDVYRYLHAPDGPCWPRELAAMDRVRDIARAHVPHTLVVLFPAFPRDVDWSDYPWADLHAQVAAAWQERGFHVIDLLPVFAESGGVPSELAVDGEHPNPRGHEIAAGAIADELAQLGWLGAQ